jgi:hypothetical protein
MPAKKTNTKAAIKAATKKQSKKEKPAAPKKLSALDAAAQVLSENGGSMTTKELIETMAAQKLWESPNGKTPAATLYAAILREITTKGPASRFQKTEPGKFVASGAAKTRPTEEQPAPAKAPKKAKAAKGTKKKTGKKAEATDEPAPIPDGTEGPESMKELFRLS